MIQNEELPLSPWDPTGPLSRGITLIEASAGTGKTYNITSLVVRLVAEEAIPIDRICIVTFTRAATAELRDRVRRRLADAAHGLQERSLPSDPIVALLWQTDAEERQARIRRLHAAVRAFDQALIATIHGFCQRMLQVHAFESGVAFDLELVPDTDALRAEQVDDYLSRSLYELAPDEITFLHEQAGFKRDELLKLAKAAVADPDTPVWPDTSPPPQAWEHQVRALAQEWDALVSDFADYVDGQVQAAKSGNPSVLRPRQRKHSKAAVLEWGAAMGEWLRSDPPLGSIPAEAWRFGLRATRAQLVDPEVGFEHPCLAQLDALMAVVDAVVGGRRADFVAEVRRRFEARKAQLRIQTYQDLLRGLATRLDPSADPGDRAALAGSMGATFDAVLIDEFQDTDHHQWTIFHTAFGQGAHHLYLIGDPKQAIYGFRGANIHVYGQATRQAERRFTMDTNWRSDARLLTALNHLLHQPKAFGAGAPFDYIPVHAPEANQADGLRPAGSWGPDSAPVQLRWVHPDAIPDADPQKPLPKGRLWSFLSDSVASHIVELLQDGTQLSDGEGFRPVRPGDIAVLVRKGPQAVQLQEALAAVGVPAVLTGAASVLASDEARELERWIAALAEGPSGGAARAAASTRMFGWTAEELMAVEREEPEAIARWDRWAERLVSWRELWTTHGFMRAFRQAMDGGVVQRLLGLSDGERRVTNLFHVAELVHAAEIRQRLRPEALWAWLVQRRAAGDLEADEVELRLDRDAEAVRLLTIHKSKGLEFPICFVPYLWDGAIKGMDPGQPLLVPDPARLDRRILDVGRPHQPTHQALAVQESREEALRLAYVALTRARHRVVLYGAWATDYATSALAAILHGEAPDRPATAERRVRAGLQPVLDDLEARQGGGVDGAPGFAVLPCILNEQARYEGPDLAPPALAVRRFQRGALDPGWRRHSYTSVSRAAGEPELVEEGREGFDADAVDPPLPSLPAPDAAEVPLAGFPGGAAAGTLLHEILEAIDFSAEPEAIAAEAKERLGGYGMDPERYAALLAEGLVRTLNTPLGHALGERTLAQIPRHDRLDELRFDLPIRGGAARRDSADLQVAAQGLIEALTGRAGELPAGWLDTLSRLRGLRLAGFLTGSIDLVFRAEGRWYVVDYKSNRLDPRRTGRCLPSAFDNAGMTQEMARHDYFLQYHLYLVALHRFLTWRLPDYDYDAHVGGVYYLFLRGMVGPETAREGEAVYGAWFDRPPREVVERLDAALRGPDRDAQGGGR